MAQVLLINPSYVGSYGGNKMSVVNPIYPTLSLATIAAMAMRRDHRVKVLDLSHRPYDHCDVASEIRSYQPDVIGITTLTPSVQQAFDISILVKDISPHIQVVAGGPHASSLPVETLMESKIDAVCVGEGDYTFAEICDGKKFREIPGLYYRDLEECKFTGWRTPIADLDELPFPAWELYDPEFYTKHISRLLCKRPPMTTVEFSRGCVFKCDFCASKMTMALGYRRKSPKRCAEEVQHLCSLGFREFMLADDIFTTDPKWALAVCEAILATGVKMAWTCTNGIRVESAEDQLFKTLRKAGCYRVSFGFESGNDTVLKGFGKGGKATIERGRQAVQMANRAKIDTMGFFMLGLSCDTKETMAETIEFARSLPLQLLKFSITIAFPGTNMFNDYVKKGLIRSYNWEDYHVYTGKSLFAHENLSYDDILKYMKHAFRRAILMNPAFIVRRIWRGIKTGEFFWDVYYFVLLVLKPTTNKEISMQYYARDRWPKWDFNNHAPAESVYQKVGSKHYYNYSGDRTDLSRHAAKMPQADPTDTPSAP